MRGFFVRDEPDAVLQFYRRELLAQGWQPEEPPALRSTSALPSEEAYSLVSFVKGDLRVAIVAWPNQKDARLGATALSIVVEPQAPADLIAVRDSLPLPPGASRRALIGPLGLQASYFVPDKQDAVVEFYQRELAARGWQLEDRPPPQWAIENLGSQVTSVTSFVKDDARVVIMVGPNEKDPSRGATLLEVAIEERS